jgi:hypothetical protein
MVSIEGDAFEDAPVREMVDSIATEDMPKDFKNSTLFITFELITNDGHFQLILITLKR